MEMINYNPFITISLLLLYIYDIINIVTTIIILF